MTNTPNPRLEKMLLDSYAKQLGKMQEDLLKLGTDVLVMSEESEEEPLSQVARDNADMVEACSWMAPMVAEQVGSILTIVRSMRSKYIA